MALICSGTAEKVLAEGNELLSKLKVAATKDNGLSGKYDAYWDLKKTFEEEVSKARDFVAACLMGSDEAPHAQEAVIKEIDAKIEELSAHVKGFKDASKKYKQLLI